MTTLDHDLRALADAIDWPPTPDVAAAVLPRLAAEPAPRRRHPLLRPRARLVLVTALLIALAVAAVPPARSAVLDLFGLTGGEQARRVRVLPPAPRREDPSQAPGARTTLQRARGAVDFPVRVPAVLGAADGVRLWTGLPGGVVVLTYGREDALWAFRGSSSHFVRKFVTPATTVRTVRVGRDPATWLTRTPHEFVVEGPDGQIVQGSAAIVDANVLVWSHAGVAYRLETRGGLSRALAIARSVAAS